MDNKTLQSKANRLWFGYTMIFPKLVVFACPETVINNRFSATAGMNYSERNLVQLSGKFMVNNLDEMLRVTLPHELAHQIDYNLNGWKFGAKHHRESWKNIMIKIGLPPDLYHNMML